MNTEPKQETRSPWLTASLAAAGTIAGYRFAGVVVNLLFMALYRTGIQFMQDLYNHQAVFHLPLCLLAAIGFVYWQHRILVKKPLKTSYVALTVFVALSVCPFQAARTYHVQLPPPSYFRNGNQE